MNKDFIFYRGYLDRELAVDGEPGLLAATEVVQAVCDAGFQRNGFSMKSYPSSPHCYFKFAKPPKEGMYLLRAVKKTDMTSMDILIDTRIHPCFVMMEKNTDWQDEKEEVKDTVELGINIGADRFNWHVNLQEYSADTTQHLPEFISALSYINGQEVMWDMKFEECVVRCEERDVCGEERFHFVHPEIEDKEAWRIHDAIKRLVAYQKVPEICAYLKEQKKKGRLLLPSNPSFVYEELKRMGMPTGDGYSEKYFAACYKK